VSAYLRATRPFDRTHRLPFHTLLSRSLNVRTALRQVTGRPEWETEAALPRGLRLPDTSMRRVVRLRRCRDRRTSAGTLLRNTILLSGVTARTKCGSSRPSSSSRRWISAEPTTWRLCSLPYKTCPAAGGIRNERQVHQQAVVDVRATY